VTPGSGLWSGDDTLFTFAESLPRVLNPARSAIVRFPAMKLFSVPASFLAMIVVVAALIFADPLPVSSTAAGLLDGNGLDTETKAGQKMVETLGVTEVLGPLAPVALSPYFALTFMSGASLLADSGMLPDAVSKNAMLGKNSPLNNGLVFSGLLGLTALTALPKLTKVTKPFAQAIDQVEAHSGIVAVLAVQALSSVNLGESAGEQAASTVVIQAGIVSFTQGTLLMIFSAINIFVVNTVKFFFEMMIFLSPFPTVDAIFETANKSLAAALMAIYVWSPWVATVINLAIFAVSLLIFAWVRRRVVYLRSVFGDPILGWMAEAIFRRPKPTLTSLRLSGVLAQLFPNPTLVMKAFAARRFGGLRMKTRGFLVQADGKLHFVCRRFLRAPKVVPLPVAGHTLRVDKGFLAHAVVIENDVGDVAAKVSFSRRYSGLLDEIRRQLGATNEVVVEAETPEKAGVMAVSRSLGEAVKSGDREMLRAELA